MQKEDKMICLLNFYNLNSKIHTYKPLLTIPLGDVQLYDKAKLYMFNIFSSIFNWSNNGIFFSLNYKYNIYKVDSAGTALSTYSFLFPLSNSLPENYLMDTIFSKEKMQHLSNERNMITEIPDFFSVKNSIIFSTVMTSVSNAYKKSFFLYSLGTGNLLSFDHILPDALSYFLPSGNKILAEDGNNCYTTIPSYEMFQSKEATKDKHPKYPLVLQNYFATQTRKSNPVIVELTPKENL